MLTFRPSLPRRALRAALLALAFVAAAPVARAQVGGSNADARVFFERGNARFQRAQRARGLRRQQLLEEALESYVESLRIVRSKNALFNAALVLEGLERNADAFAYYREYLTVPGLTDEERSDAELQLVTLRPRVAVVAVTSEPAGAEVHVDRLDLASVGVTPLEVALPPGEHVLFVRLSGYAPEERRVQAVQGETVRAEVALVAEPVAVAFEAPEGGRLEVDGVLRERRTTLAPGEHVAVWEGGGVRGEVRFTLRVGEGPRRVRIDPALATLVVASEPAGELRVDGEAAGTGARIELELPAGPHALELRAPGRTTLERRVRLQAGETLMLAATLGEEGTPARFRPAAHTLLALGLGAAAVGAGVYGLGRSREDPSLQCRPYQPEDAQACNDQRTELRRLGGTAVGLLAGAGALGLTALVLYVSGRSRPGDESTVTVAAAATRRGALASLSVALGEPR